MLVLIVLCLLCGIEGFRFGMWIGAELEHLGRWFDDRMDREWDLHPVCAWEGWR